MSGGRHFDQDKESTAYAGNLDERVTDALLWELFTQMGPVVNVHLPKDRVSQLHQGYGFVEMRSEEDAEYACKILNNTRMFGKPIRVNKASADRRGPGGETIGGSQGVGAELFAGNLDGSVDERVLYETFSRFGPLVATPKVSSRISLCDLCLKHELMISFFFAGSTRRGRSLQGLRLPELRFFRSLRRRHRQHARPVPQQQGDHGAIRVQEGRQGRASR